MPKPGEGERPPSYQPPDYGVEPPFADRHEHDHETSDRFTEWGERMTNEQQRVKMARMLEHAPETCKRCGCPNAVVTFSGGTYRDPDLHYRESGSVECINCGERDGWRYET